MKNAKNVADEMVEASLFKRAVGYSHPAVKFFYEKRTVELNKENKPVVIPGEVVVKRFQEHYPPDTTACIFWLKNRRRDEWSDTTHHESDELHTIKIIVEEYKE